MMRRIILAALLIALIVPCASARRVSAEGVENMEGVEVFEADLISPMEAINDWLEGVEDPEAALSDLYRALMCAHYLEISNFRPDGALPSSAEYLVTGIGLGLEIGSLSWGSRTEFMPDGEGGYVRQMLIFRLYGDMELIAYKTGVFIAEDASEEEEAAAYKEARAQRYIERIALRLAPGDEVTIARFGQEG